jgi:hypothetical protein
VSVTARPFWFFFQKKGGAVAEGYDEATGSTRRASHHSRLMPAEESRIAESEPSASAGGNTYASAWLPCGFVGAYSMLRCMEYVPKILTRSEWDEIVQLRAVRESWGLETEKSEKEFMEKSYAAKFDFMSDCPGYAGELFVLLGGEPESPPIIITRRNGKLVTIDPSKD